MKTAVIYARYSSDNQSEQSIEGQLRVCQDYAKNNDIIILDTYIDRAMTGTNDNRPSFQQMLTDSKKCEWDYVLVYKFDRFSRNKYETAIHKKTLRDNGVKLMSATEYLPDTPERIIIESMFEGYAEYYSAELSQKVRRGLKESRIKGNFTGGKIVYGYNVVNKKLVINEEQAHIIRYIYEQYSIGVYVKDIITSLTARGLLNNGQPFARSSVYSILKNEKYSGKYTYNGEVFTNIYPQIVPSELFEKVRKKVLNNKYGRKSIESNYLLRNKIKCGYCGSSITAETGTSKSGKVKRYYKCIGKKHNNGCMKSTIRKDYLEEFITNTLISFLTDKKQFEKSVSILLKFQDEMNNENSTLKLLEKEKKQCENSLTNIMNAIESGIFNNTTSKRMKELETQIENLERSILLEKSKTSTKASENDIKEFFSQALTLEPQLMINYLIKEIKLYDDKIEIYFNSPILKGPDESRDLKLYSGTYELNAKTNYNKNSVAFELSFLIYG